MGRDTPWPRAGPGSLGVLGSCRRPCGHLGGLAWCPPGGGCSLAPVHPQAVNLGPPSGRSPGEGPPGRQQRVPLIWAPQQLVDCGASPACPPVCLVPPVTNSPTPRGLAGHMVSALCPFSAPGGGGRREQNGTFGGTSKVHFGNQKEFPSFPLMFCLCVVLDLNKESEETG